MQRYQIRGLETSHSKPRRLTRVGFALHGMLLFATLAAAENPAGDLPAERRDRMTAHDIDTGALRDELRRFVGGDAGVPFSGIDDFMLGPASPADRAALQRIAIPIRQERVLGQSMWRRYQQTCKAEQIALTSRSRDARYVHRLVEQLRRQMQHRDRYARVQVFVADSIRRTRRVFPAALSACIGA